VTSDQLIKERTDNHSLELCVSANVLAQNKRPAIFNEDEDDFVSLKKVGIAMNGKCMACFLSHV